jgi:(p)ppGpp synthase/HD superfamily hydrolase
LENGRSESVPAGSSEINERPRKSIREIFFGDIDQEDQPKTEKFVLRFELHRQKNSTSDVKKEESVINRNSFLEVSDLYAEEKWGPTTNSSDVNQDSDKDTGSAHANISILEAQLSSGLNLSIDSPKSNSTKAFKGVEEIDFDEILQMCDLPTHPLEGFVLFQLFIKLHKIEETLEQKIKLEPNPLKEKEVLEIVKNTLGELNKRSEPLLSQHEEAQLPEENSAHSGLSIILEEENEERSNLDISDFR